MFTRKNILSISCSDLADSINNIFGIKRNDYNNAIFIDKSSMRNIALRMRILRWLRDHVPPDEDSILLEINC